MVQQVSIVLVRGQFLVELLDLFLKRDYLFGHFRVGLQKVYVSRLQLSDLLLRLLLTIIIHAAGRKVILGSAIDG